jgi:hypothetical protein
MENSWIDKYYQPCELFFDTMIIEWNKITNQ